MVYHSAKNDEEAQQACGCSILPIVTTTRGPAPLAPEGTEDIIDEALGFFKANVLFKHFEVKGGGDRVMIYLTLYITQCLQRLEKCPSPQEGIKALTAMAGESFKIPGDAGFALGSFYPTPASAQEAELCRSYFRQVREETGRRLITKVYSVDGSPSKFWLVFAKKKFMNKVRAPRRAVRPVLPLPRPPSLPTAATMPQQAAFGPILAAIGSHTDGKICLISLSCSSPCDEGCAAARSTHTPPNLRPCMRLRMCRVNQTSHQPTSTLLFCAASAKSQVPGSRRCSWSRGTGFGASPS